MNISNLIPIESTRLILDSFKEEDYKDFHEILNSDYYQKFNQEEYKPCEEEGIMYYTRDLSKQNLKDVKAPLVFAIRLKENEQFIGFIGLTNGELKSDGTIEIYFSINKNHWNKGYATESLNKLIDFCFNELNIYRIFTGTDIDNFASQKVMEKVGMSFESRWRKDRVRQGKRTDGLGFSILRDDRR